MPRAWRTGLRATSAPTTHRAEIVSFVPSERRTTAVVWVGVTVNPMSVVRQVTARPRPPCQVLDEQSFGFVLREPERVTGKA
jgi:hypothetical protein